MIDKLTVPICVSCRAKMRCKKVGFIVSHNNGFSEVQWRGDLFNCPQCLVEIVVGLGTGYKVDKYFSDEADIKLNYNIKSFTKLP